MTQQREHPGPTGVGKPDCWQMPISDRRNLERYYRKFCADDSSWGKFLADLEVAIRIYRQMKEVGEKSSAGAVRCNLRAALAAATRLQLRIKDLDSNSLDLVRRSGNLRMCGDIGRAVDSLRSALSYAEENYPLRGPRPRPERDHLAAMILMALRRYTSADPTAKEGQPFERLLKISLRYAKETNTDLHQLAGRALAGVVAVEEKEGLLSLSAPNAAKNGPFESSEENPSSAK